MTPRPHPGVNFDEIAAGYAEHRRVHPGVFQELVSVIAPAPRARVLELGCGTGNYAIALRQRCNISVIGLDPSRQMLAHAAARAWDIDWICGRAEALPLVTQCIDVVFSVDVIHHIADRMAAFREARRVLRPGGWFCTVTDSAEDIRRREPLSRYFPATVPMELARYPSITTIERELVATGFEEIRRGHVEFRYPLTDVTPFRDRVFSSLRLIPEDHLEEGLRRMEADLQRGPVSALSLYTLIWARVPLQP
jgi:ubiquinone/menaquinone biosynthesis C-methylase UbiE